MLHERAQIRHAIRGLLLGKTDAADRVYASRKLPVRKVELPVLLVYTLDEQADEPDTAPRELDREVSVTIEGWVTPGVDVDDKMDALALQVEEAMHADPFLAGKAGDSYLSGTDIELLEEGEQMVGLVVLTYAVTYRTLAPRPPADGDLDDFRTVHATHNVGGEVHEDEVAVDDFVVQEEP